MSKTWHNQKIAEKALEAFKLNGFSVFFFQTTKDAVTNILNLIPKDNSVGVGGSKTLHELNLPQLLEDRGNTMFNHNKPNLTRDEHFEICRKQLTCDTFITSTNAFTIDGKLANVDGFGNRVAAMTFGPKQVIVVTGINKLTYNIDEALKRIQNYAAPANAHRLHKETPCNTTGLCINCQSPSRICRITSILSKKPSSIDSYIICIIGENLGF